MTRRAMFLAAVVALAAAGCQKKKPVPVKVPEPQHDKWSDAWILAEGDKFLGDDAYRRAALERSLFNHQNSYSRQRLGSYALPGQGWDALPVWNPISAWVTAEIAAGVRGGAEPTLPAELKPLWDGKRPTTMAEWVALGEKVFFTFPMRSEVFVEWLLADAARTAELGPQVGVVAAPDGSFPGVVAFKDIDGRSRLGITCALCHTNIETPRGAAAETLVVGSARRRFDYGALRLAYHAETGEPLDAELARRMKGWGPGRADVTEDEGEDPVAIPDLWGIRHQTSLTQAGSIRHESPLALAIRQETQLLHSNHQRIRPPRELAWALAMYVYSITPPREAAPPVAQAEIDRGKGIFANSCATCHSNAGFGGELIPAEKVGTDRALADGKGRGTGHYRPPPLVRVHASGPYLHHGVVPTLEELFSTARLGETSKGRGHNFGTDLLAADKAALLSYLQTL